MAFAPVSVIASHYKDFSGYWLKAYIPGTTTPKTMAIDSAGSGSAAKFELNVNAFFVTSGGAIVNPHIDGPYDLWLFPTEAEADANDTSNAERLADNLTAPGSHLINDLSQAYEFATVAAYKSSLIEFPDGKTIRLLDRVADFTKISGQSGLGFGTIPSTSVSQSVVIIHDVDSTGLIAYGADPTGVIDCTGAKDACIASGESFPVQEGTYLCDGIKILNDGQNVRFTGVPILKANANGVVLFYHTANFTNHEGVFRTDSNSKTNVWGMACAPADLTQTTTLVQNNSNIMPGILGDPGLTECTVLQAGPDVGGADSGCWYNHFPYIRAQGAVRGVWLRSPPNAGGSPCNRNTFQDIRVGTSGGISSNTGIQIDAGDTNEFYGFKGEGISNATGPNATATAIKILDSDPVSGASNNHNKFFGGACEACTRDLDVSNIRTEFYGLTNDDTKSIFTNGLPLIKIGGNDSSVCRQISMGAIFTNVAGDFQPDTFRLETGKLGFPVVQLPTADPNTLDDYREAVFTPTISFGGASVGITYSSQSGFFTKIGREVHFRLIIGLTAKGSSTGAASIDDLPFNSNATVNNFSAVSMRPRNTSFADMMQGFISTNTSSISLEEITNAGTVTSLDDTNFTNTSSFIISGSYMV